MEHKRAQIRKAAAADLLGLPTTGENVYAGRRFRIYDLILPCLLVYFDDEVSEAIDVASGAAGRTQQREGQLVVQGVAAAPEAALDDLLDRMALEAEERLFAAASGGLPGAQLAPLVTEWQISKTEIAASPEGATLYGQIAMTFEATYQALENQPV